MTVNLTRIYTRLGDGGETHLGDMSRVPKTHARIEAYGTVDELNAQLPGGTAAAAQLHVCRTVARRAERRTIACGEEVNAECVRYLNRLSDLLFILSRGVNVAAGGAEPLWEPGRFR